MHKQGRAHRACTICHRAAIRVKQVRSESQPAAGPRSVVVVEIELEEEVGDGVVLASLGRLSRIS